MTPELVKAIKERITSGQEKATIKDEVLSMGYTEELFEAAYTLAVHDTASAGAPVSPTAVSSIHTLVKSALHATLNQWGLVVLLAVPLLLLTLLAELDFRFTADMRLMGLFSGLSIVVFLWYLINIMVVLYLVSRRSDLEKTTYLEGFHWAKRNFFGIFFVYLLTVLAVWGGFMLFIIPGFFLLISLYFSQYIFVLEGKRGMAALLRSREIVKGRWWTVLKKVIGLSFYFIIPVFVASFMIGIVEAFYSLEQFRVLGEIVLQVATGFFTVISMHVMFSLYRELSAGVADVPASKVVAFWHWVVIAAGVLVTVAFVIALVFFGITESLKDSMSLSIASDKVVGELSTLASVSDEYQSTNGSFAGVCDSLTSELAEPSDLECHDSEQAWALSATSGEERFCVDSLHSSPKRIQTSLDGSTSCFGFDDLLSE
jgi:hypothetical protein